MTETTTMTRQGFELIAGVMAEVRPGDVSSDPVWRQWMGTVGRLADALATTNSRFDRERFTRACNGWIWVAE